MEELILSAISRARDAEMFLTFPRDKLTRKTRELTSEEEVALNKIASCIRTLQLIQENARTAYDVLVNKPQPQPRYFDYYDGALHERSYGDETGN